MANKNLWNEVEVPTGNQQDTGAKKEFKDIPDGRDRVGVVKGTGVHESKYGESLYFDLYDAAENIRQRFFWGIDLANENKIVAIKRMLGSLELPIPSDPSDLAAVLARAEGYEVKFDKWTKVTDAGKKYQNIAVTQVLSKGGARPEQPADDVDDEEIPFGLFAVLPLAGAILGWI